MATSYEYIQKKIEDAKLHYNELRNLPNHEIFSIICIRYFFYDIEENFSIEETIGSIVDGKDDGGIDAIFMAPDEESNDIVIIQSKYYDNTTKISKDDIIHAVGKIQRCLKDLKNHRYSNYNESLINRYTTLKNENDEKIVPRIFFFTSYDQRTQKSITSIEKALKDEFPDINIELKFGKDICQQIENQEQSKTCIDKGKLIIDKKDNILRYGNDAIMANISAQSLAELYHRYGNALLGLNLRYYIRNKDVDSGIERTITEHPKEFWYRNNGITLICEDYELDGNEIHLSTFSIINGGQTTYRISKADIEDDFYLLCKIVKRRGNTTEEKDNFVVNISRSTNAQKPVKPSDLTANAPEQLKIKSEFSKLGVKYITKRGEKYSKAQFAAYKVTTIQKFGKASLASVLQQPGKARNSQTAIFKEDIYKRIYFNPNIMLISDILRVEYYYEKYKKEVKQNKQKHPTLKAIVSNGTTFQLAAITYLSLIHKKHIDIETVYNHEETPDEIVKLIRKSASGNWKLFTNNLSEQEEYNHFSRLFSLVAEDIILPAYQSFKEAHSDADIPVANFLKNDKIYSEKLIHRLTTTYSHYSESIKNILDILCGKQNP